MKHKVCVIGAGVIGLSTAVNIIERNPNVEVTLIAEKFSPQTTGDGASGWWKPYLPGDTPVHLVKRWGKVTWNHLTALLHSEIRAQIGIQVVAGYNLSKTPEDPFWKDDVFGFRQVPTEELKKLFPPDFGFPYGFAYTSLVTECQKYLPWLLERFQRQGGTVQCRRVNSVSELVFDYDVVVNCSGINAFDLVNDREMIPFKGQHIRVYAPWHKIMVAAVSPEELTYAIPGSDFVTLGGTAHAGRWDTDIDPKDGLDIFNRCCKMIPSLKGAKILEEWTGLRPGRKSIRLEKEYMKFGRHTLPVVHNYGHGGSGITLHWGCAEDAAALVDQCLEEKRNLSSKL